MRVRSALWVVTLVAAGAGLGGCPSDSCPLESPQVSAIPTSCTEVAGQPVSYPVRLCPACNQTAATCAVDASQAAQSGYIFLDVKMQACSGGSSCPPPSCNPGPTPCTFTAPATPGNYTVVISDGQGGQFSEPLTVIASGPESCALASAAPATF